MKLFGDYKINCRVKENNGKASAGYARKGVGRGDVTGALSATWRLRLDTHRESEVVSKATWRSQPKAEPGSNNIETIIKSYSTDDG